jgi:hypothetical protein
VVSGFARGWLAELVKATGANHQDTDDCAGAMIGEVGAYQENTQIVLRTWTKLQRKERAEAERKLQLQRQAQASPRRPHTPDVVNSTDRGGGSLAPHARVTLEPEASVIFCRACGLVTA